MTEWESFAEEYMTEYFNREKLKYFKLFELEEPTIEYLFIIYE